MSDGPNNERARIPGRGGARRRIPGRGGARRRIPGRGGARGRSRSSEGNNEVSDGPNNGRERMPGRGGARGRNRLSEGDLEIPNDHNNRMGRGPGRGRGRGQERVRVEEQGRHQSLEETRREKSNSNNNENGQNRRKKHEHKSMHIVLLEKIVHTDCNNIFNEIALFEEQFMDLLQMPQDNPDIYVLLMNLIYKVCQSNFEQLKLQLILKMCNSNFLKNLTMYIVHLPYSNRKINMLYWNEPHKFWEHFLISFECITSLSPSTAYTKCRPLIENVSKSCLELLNTEGFVLSEELDTRFSRLREKMYKKEETIETQKSSNCAVKTVKGPELPPPNSFRELSVLPTDADLLEEVPFVRPNIVDGAYTDVEHYLDVQYRLLREDCFGPLREGIRQYFRNPNCRKFDNIRVYKKVCFDEFYVSQMSYGYLAQLSKETCKKFKTINWKCNKRFLYGSLVIFINEKTKNIIVGTILDREFNLLRNGKIPVALIDGNKLSHKDEYTMVESEVYFEPYFHVLNVLRDPSFVENMCMQKYIIHVDPEPQPPVYLNDCHEYTVKVPKTNIKYTFDVFDFNTWPTNEKLCLNESQYEAYKLALTHEFSVIQGPPGTGKTYLGVQIAQTLLKNVVYTGESLCLMLVICYTNHALDQFLDAILKITEKVVRVGGQSRNETLKNKNINILRSNLRRGDLAVMFKMKDALKVTVEANKQMQINISSVNNGLIKSSILKNVVAGMGAILTTLKRHYGMDDEPSTIVEDTLISWLFEENDANSRALEIDQINETIKEFDEIKDDDNKSSHRAAYTDDDETDLDLSQMRNICSFSIKEYVDKLKTKLSMLAKSTNTTQIYEIHHDLRIMNNRIRFFKIMQEHYAENILDENEYNQLCRRNVLTMPAVNRWRLYFYWVLKFKDIMQTKVPDLLVQFEDAKKAYEEARIVVDLKIFKENQVIGMTTSSAARINKVLKELKPPIVIVEEAAEVLEQHIITSLYKDCQHLILIGDHQQLRPSAAHMKLAREYNIEVSLFERMITNKIHSRRLSVQHRMRPEMASLISPHIYRDLLNHPSVQRFPNVKGVTCNMFFWTHEYLEQCVDGDSRSNPQEGDLVLKLANYLMQQGYEPADITVLAAYSGQMFYLKQEKLKYNFLDKIKVTVVDNYQGEESKIILLSLVRNNNQGRIGFLQTDNRVCVALSRAREGLFIFGNMKVLQSKSQLWKNISQTLEEKGLLGKGLRLKCENHPDQITVVTEEKDFDQVPEGGCMLKCSFNLNCLHPCPLVCHSYDTNHVNVGCVLKCERVICDFMHICPLMCAQKCLPCKVKVVKTLNCKHEKRVLCSDDLNTVKCMTLLSAVMTHCQHPVEKPCSLDINQLNCPVPCEGRANCGHKCERTCHVKDDPDHEKYVCEKPCKKQKRGCSMDGDDVKDEHICNKQCYESCDDCIVEVSKKRNTCKHFERVACNVDVDLIPCRKNCTRLLECNHHCKNKCSEPCGNCKQMVIKRIPECGHLIKIQCMDIPSRVLCESKCCRILSCGHACTQPCKETCTPSKCTVVTEYVNSPCGHKVRLPCNVYQAYRAGDDNLNVERYCTELCNTELSCEHLCGGSCGSCYQGRLHQPCVMACHKQLICGHRCEEPCNKLCPPCSLRCEVRCQHSKCTKQCGEPCVPCKEKCSRKCVHRQCTRRCGERCEVPACNEPCPKLLECQHQCRGLCGEPCPDICNICKPDTFPCDFLGDPFEDDAKFVKLEDCSHILEMENMDNLMRGDTETIAIRQCPYCRKPIINTHRYKDLINTVMKKDIDAIKIRVFGTSSQIKTKLIKLKTEIESFEIQIDSDSVPIVKDSAAWEKSFIRLLDICSNPAKTTIIQLDTRFSYLHILQNISQKYDGYYNLNIKKIKTQLHQQITMVCDALRKSINKITQQQLNDIANELKRMHAIIQLEKIHNSQNYSYYQHDQKIQVALKETQSVIFKLSAYCEEGGLNALHKLEKSLKANGIITQMERDMVVKAMNFKSGHWFKCPNGHYYCIDACGGAMEIGKCNECGSSIGGTSHRLLNDNRHAGEMDNSKFAAYSEEANNMNNYRF